MRSSARTSLLTVLAVVLLLSSGVLPVASAAPARSTASSQAVSPARHAAAKAALERVVKAFSVKRGARTGPRTTPLPRTDVTLLLRDLHRSLGALTPAERATADTYLAKPAAGGISTTCTGTVVQSAHFCIHYSNPGLLNPDGATPAQAQLTADTFEYVYTREVTQLGYRSPLNDGNGLLDVYLQNLGNQGIYGYCDTDGVSPDGSTSPAYCAVDNDFSTAEFGAPPLNSLRVTAAHEFFHAVQFAYDANDSSWFLEGTAVWMEDIVYPTINDYLQYLPASQVVRPNQSTDYAGGIERYGTVTFWKFLSERFGDNNIIRQIWNAAAASAGNRNGIRAVSAVLAAKGHSFAPEFARYGVWNTLPPHTYGDRNLWLKRVSPGAWATTTLTRANHDTGGRSVHLNHLAHAPLIVRPGSDLPTRAKLRVGVDGPNSSHGTRASVEIRFKNGTVKTYAMSLNSVGKGAAVLGYNRAYVRSAIVILTNGSIGYNDQVFKVRVRAVY